MKGLISIKANVLPESACLIESGYSTTYGDINNSELTSTMSTEKNVSTAEQPLVGKEVIQGIVVDDEEAVELPVDRHQIVDNQYKSSLNTKNYLNLLVFAINIFCNFVIGVTGIAPYDIGGLSDMYQTIISPAGYAFSIWSLIFITEGIFCFAQLLRRYRSSAIVQEGISWYFILANLFQASWVFAWCWNRVAFALALMLGIFASLYALVINQHLMYSREPSKFQKTYLEYWLFQFPFHVHCGWITAATSLNINIEVIHAGVNDPSIQLSVGIVTLAALHAIALAWLYMSPGTRPNYTIPLVLAWAFFAISDELSQPMENIQQRFGSIIIEAIRYSSAAVAVIIVMLCVSRLVYDSVKTKFFVRL